MNREYVKLAAKDAKRGIAHPRSFHWPRVRRKWLADYPVCAACGGTLKVEVHHVLPFHLYPQLELETVNFITLCEAAPYHCHLVLGHKGNWRDINPNVRQDAAKARAEKLQQPDLLGTH